ncbi:MAG: hypothetical protein ACERKZ_06985 [Lachnotalea sp.]
MKKFKSYIAVFIMIMLVTGCSLSDFDADINTVYVKKDGSVTDAIIEDFSETYYDSTELESLINDSIDAYNDGTEKIKVKKYTVKDDIAKLITNYETASDYVSFNKVDFFAGTISEATKSGYDFAQEFTGIEDKNTVGSETIMSLTQYKVIAFNENVEIKTDSKILYISNNAELVNDKTAKLTDGAQGLAYIVYE